MTQQNPDTKASRAGCAGREGEKTSNAIAKRLGVSSSAVRMTDAWKHRVKEAA